MNTQNSYGKVETEKLIQNLQSQLDRLVEQLADLENCKDEIDNEDYNETKEDTLNQLNELNNSLQKLTNGDISLVNSLGAVQLATQAAISQAFKTPEVIRLFGRKEPKLLREKLQQLDNDVKLNKLNADAAERQKAEILTALRQLGEQLSSVELQLLQKHNDLSNVFKNMDFVEVNM